MIQIVATLQLPNTFMYQRHTRFSIQPFTSRVTLGMSCVGIQVCVVTSMAIGPVSLQRVLLLVSVVIW